MHAGRTYRACEQTSWKRKVIRCMWVSRRVKNGCESGLGKRGGRLLNRDASKQNTRGTRTVGTRLPCHLSGKWLLGQRTCHCARRVRQHVSPKLFRTARGRRTDGKRLRSSASSAAGTIRLNPFHSPPLILFATHDGGRAHEIPPFESVVGASRSASPKPRHIALQTGIDNNNMAQSEGGAKAGGEARYVGKEEHGSHAAEGTPDILRMATVVAPYRELTVCRNPMSWSPSSSVPLESATSSALAVTRASSASSLQRKTKPSLPFLNWSTDRKTCALL